MPRIESQDRARPAALRLRLVRNDDEPATNPTGDAFLFGLQDNTGTITAGRLAEDGRLVFDFWVRVRPTKGTDGPTFTGPFVNGPAHDRFVYLAWRSIPRGEYINRVKSRLGAIGWSTVRTAQDGGQVLAADMTGWLPGDPRKQVVWRLDERSQPPRDNITPRLICCG